MNQKEAHILVETKNTYEIVLMTDHSEQPIGGIDIMVQQKVIKTEDSFQDMASILSLINDGIEKNYMKVEELISAAMEEIKIGMDFGKRNLPLKRSKI